MPTGIVQDWRAAATISIEEAGSVLGIGRSVAYRLAGSGGLPTLRLGRRLVVPTVALRRMLGEIEPKNTSSPQATGSAQGVDIHGVHNPF